VRAEYDAAGESVGLRIRNLSGQAAHVRVLDRYTGHAVSVSLAPNQDERLRWKLEASYGWYDLLVTEAGDADFSVELAGHLETGRPGVSDPALGGLRLKG
jgi:phospholipase C